MRCILCNKSKLSVVSKKDAKSSEFLQVSVCKKCGLVQQDPPPTENDIKEFYSKEYRVEYKNTYTPKPKHIYRAGKSALSRLAFLSDNNVKNCKLLDVGGGGGELVYLSSKYGFSSFGIEPNVGYSNFAKKEYGVNIKTGELNDVSEKYDLITMFHVLEHMLSPVSVFEKLWSIIETGGLLFIEVPNIETKAASPHNIYFKAHIYYFSVATLTACASQFFEVVSVNNESNIRILFKSKEIKENDITLPNQKEVLQTLNRLKHKGWIEYLIAGKGFFKLFNRIKSLLRERKVKNTPSIDILDNLLTNHSHNTGQP